ncbi:MAG TPA: hypothetical protein VMR52_00555 [Dehalococcoidia bacterium]|nr:hypothetical protein [Dehalococcoidia bacterium]
MTPAEPSPYGEPPSAPPPSSPPLAAPTPVQDETHSRAEPAGSSVDVAALLTDARSRWGVEQSPVFTAALVLAAAAFVLGTIAVILFLVAASDDPGQRDDAFAMFSVAIPAAIGAAALLAYLRLEAGTLSGPVHSQDRMIGFAIYGLCLVFTLLMLYKGLDESLSAETGWYYYALLFAFFALGFNIIARPVPAVLAGVASAMIGFVGIAVAMVVAVIGALQYRSDDFSTYAMGYTLIDAALIVALLSIAWFLGMRRVDSRM